MIYEIEQTDKKQIKQKRWITLEMRNFKKAILRLNTKKRRGYSRLLFKFRRGMF